MSRLRAVVLFALGVAVPASVIGLVLGQQWIGYICLALATVIMSGGAFVTAWEDWKRP